MDLELVTAEKKGKPRVLKLLLFAWRSRLLFLAAGIVAGVVIHKFGYVGIALTRPGAYARAVIADLSTNPERIVIDVKHMDYQKILYNRDQSLKGLRNVVTYEYVPAGIVYKGERIPVKMRLKGDRAIHISEPDKMSFRVKVRGENSIFGMKVFSLQKPRTKNYIYEWVFHQALMREGIVSPRYLFADVVLNGKKLGIYAVEEHMDKTMLESNHRREGPILRFAFLPYPMYYENNSYPFRERRYSSPEFKQMSRKAMSLLDSFKRGELKVGEVFDVDRLATYFALVDLLGASHATTWNNIRFYYNPISSRLEPVGFDSHYGCGAHTICLDIGLNPVEGRWLHGNCKQWYQVFFNNPETFDAGFIRKYYRELKRFSKREYLDVFFKDIDDELKKNLGILDRDQPLLEDKVYSYGPFLFKFSKDAYYKQQEMIRRKINLDGRFNSRDLFAYLNNVADNHVELGLRNILHLPLEIGNICIGGDSHELPLLSTERILHARNPRADDLYGTFVFKFPRGFSWSEEMRNELKLRYRILGDESYRDVDVIPIPSPARKFVAGDLLRRKPNAGKFEFIEIDDEAKTMNVKPGRWTVSEPVLIPEGYTVKCAGGTVLDLVNGAVIISFSPLSFTGYEDGPIVVTSTDSKGQGVFVSAKSRPSRLVHVVFSNLSNPSRDGWALTGAVTFHRSPVYIGKCAFTGSRSEDGLNLVHSEFTISESSFDNTSFDAFDADFSDGVITDTVFRACGNDAMDVSGSEIKISGVTVDGAGDKGLSAGEQSRVTLKNSVIKKAFIGIASKDLSVTNACGDVQIIDCRIGLAAYRKKPEFGPGYLYATLSGSSGLEKPYLLEDKSIMEIECVRMKPNRENIYEYLMSIGGK